MSVFTYNSVTLPYSYHPTFQQEAVYEESNTDKLYTKFDITVSAVLNTNYATIFGGGGVAAGDTPAAIMNKIRARLLTPRKALTVSFGGTDIVPGPAGAGFVDAKNGPHPQAFNATQLTNTTFLVTYRIITHQAETAQGADGQGSVTGATVLSNRWTEKVTIDDCNYTTRTRNGYVYIRSDNRGGLTADDIREAQAIPGVPNGFLRQSYDCEVSADGLKLSYQCTDKEQHYMPPPGVFKAEGSYMETSTRFAAQRRGKVTVKLWGDKETNEHALLRVAVSVATNKLIEVGALNKDNHLAILEHASISRDLYHNIFTVEMESVLDPNFQKEARAKVAGFDLQLIQKGPLGSLPAPDPPDYLSRGTADIFVQAAKYADASRTTLFSPDEGNLDSGKIPGQAGGGE